MDLLIKDVILNCKKQDIYIDEGKIKKIGKNLNFKAKEEIDVKGEKAALPGLINSHCHAAMTLFRGYADDCFLQDWWENKILPLEGKLTQEDVYWGSKLACLEMIKTGTLFFNDMYWYPEATIEAVNEMGLRASIGIIVIDFNKKGSRESCKKAFKNLEESDLVKLNIAPHAIYSVSKDNLIWAKDFAQKRNLILHIHISETEKEVNDCQKKYGMRPVEYLDKIGLLGKNTVLAHAVWLSDEEINILGKRKVSVVYNPISNLKLAVGRIFPYRKLREAGVNVCLGTDGAASNNNLNLFEEIKVGAILQKYRENDPTIPKAKEALDFATINGARAFGMKAGEIREGNLADLILVDLNKTFFCPGYNMFSDIAYSFSGTAISDAICNGKILMRDGGVDGEREIIRKTREISKDLIKR